MTSRSMDPSFFFYDFVTTCGVPGGPCPVRVNPSVMCVDVGNINEKAQVAVNSIQKIREVARIAHEVIRSYCTSIHDPPLPGWDESPEWAKDSVINGVLQMIADPLRGPAANHEGWLAERAAAGWVYGEVKDTEKKTHPCMVPYSSLSNPQKVKNILFVSVVRALLDSTLADEGKSSGNPHP